MEATSIIKIECSERAPIHIMCCRDGSALLAYGYEPASLVRPGDIAMLRAAMDWGKALTFSAKLNNATVCAELTYEAGKEPCDARLNVRATCQKRGLLSNYKADGNGLQVAAIMAALNPKHSDSTQLRIVGDGESILLTRDTCGNISGLQCLTGGNLLQRRRLGRTSVGASTAMEGRLIVYQVDTGKHEISMLSPFAQQAWDWANSTRKEAA